MINTNKHMLPFSPDVKMIPAYFFLVSRAFLKEYPVILILIPEVWEEMKLFALHCTSRTLQNYDLFTSFLSFLARIRIRTWQKLADLCVSGSETLIYI